MKPGRELDALVAEKVMEWSFKHSLQKCANTAFERCRYCLELNSDSNPILLKCKGFPSYSTDISAAWEVVEKLSADYRFTVIGTHLKSHWVSFRGNNMFFEAHGESFPHAICIAALMAVGHFGYPPEPSEGK